MTLPVDPRIAQSVHQRLLNHARAKGEDFQIVLQGYLLERFLYRLGRSDLRQTFALKGAVLLRLWADQPYRATVDLDLLQPAPQILAYAPETVIAEKLEAMIVHGIANSRIKDFFDLHYLSRRFAFEGGRVVHAINTTFEQRSTRVPTGIPIGLTDEFWQTENRVAHLRAFARRAHLEASVETARALLPELRAFLLPPLEAVRRGTGFPQIWPAGGVISRWTDEGPTEVSTTTEETNHAAQEGAHESG